MSNDNIEIDGVNRVIFRGDTLPDALNETQQWLEENKGRIIVQDLHAEHLRNWLVIVYYIYI